MIETWQPEIASPPQDGVVGRGLPLKLKTVQILLIAAVRSPQDDVLRT
jgi:hypothetical protein